MAGRPKGRKDNPVNPRNKRQETETQKAARIQKTADTRRKKNQASKAAASEKSKVGLGEADNTDTGVNSPRQAKDVSQTVTTNNVSEQADSNQDDITTNNGNVQVAPALNITANLDIDEDNHNTTTAESVGGEEQNVKDEQTLGVQQEYVKAIQLRLREEVKIDNDSTDLWMLEHLKQNNWWIRKEKAHYFTKKLGLKKSHAAYYRDVHIWLPDIRWTDVDCTPCCPTCKSNEQVANNGFHHDHFGRVIVGLKETYYVMTRRYCCYSCCKKSKEVAQVIDQAFINNENVTVEKAIDELRYNFMGWDEQSLSLLPFGRGSEFPAFLTHKAGVDKLIVDMMRPLFDKGIKPESLSNMLLELHTAEFTMKSVRHEYEIKSRLNSPFLPKKNEPLGDFADKFKYRGIVPTGRYLAHVYKKFHQTIRQYLAREVKKRDMDVLAIDVSYKEAKCLYQYHGKSVFRGLVTGLNQYGEVRIQFHIYTDSHEQMLSSLQEFEKTRSILGFPGVTHVISDNPKRDMSLFTSAMASVKQQQAKYDSKTPVSIQDPISGREYYDPKHLLVKVAHGSAEINRSVDAMREEIKGNAVGLDAEWNRILNSRGIQTNRGKIQWIQIAYRNNDNNIRVLLLWVGGERSVLPTKLRLLLEDSSIRFAGNKVSGDLKYIGEDFNIGAMKAVDQKKRENVINLGTYAKNRGVVNNANVKLSLLSELTLGKAMDKSQQTSTWTKELSDDQKQYAAIDAAASFEVYERLEKMKDLSRRLSEEDAQ